MKYVKEVRQRFRNASVFTISDLKVFLKPRGISNAYLYLLVHNLLAKSEAERITKGVFTFKDEVQTVGFAFQPFYYGLQDALSLRNLWEQETNPIVITPRRVRVGLRSFKGRNYLVRRINRKMFFGFEMLKYGDFWIPVSNAEKTLIDFAYFNEPLDKNALKELKRLTRKNVLKDYLKHCPQKTKEKVNQMLNNPPR